MNASGSGPFISPGARPAASPACSAGRPRRIASVPLWLCGVNGSSWSSCLR